MLNFRCKECGFCTINTSVSKYMCPDCGKIDWEYIGDRTVEFNTKDNLNNYGLCPARHSCKNVNTKKCEPTHPSGRCFNYEPKR